MEEDRSPTRGVEAFDHEEMPGHTIPQLRAKLMILARIIKEARADGDVRWKVAADQQRRINVIFVEKIRAARKAAGIPEPPAVVVGLKPVRMNVRRVKM